MKDHHEILSEYLLGDISDARRKELESEIASDPELAAEIAELGPIVAKLEALPDEAWSDAEPPAFTLPGRAAPVASTAPTVPAEPRPAASPPPRPARREGALQRFFGGSFSLRPALALGCALLLFAGGVGVGALSGGSDNAPIDALGPTVQQASLSPVAEFDQQATGSADVKHDGKLIRLKLSGLKPNSEEDFYEAWLMDPKNGLVAIGTFTVDERGEAKLDLPVPVGTDRYPVVDISLQPVDGKPTHSGVSVLRGKLES